jgi:hypothetical protein
MLHDPVTQRCVVNMMSQYSRWPATTHRPIRLPTSRPFDDLCLPYHVKHQLARPGMRSIGYLLVDEAKQGIIYALIDPFSFQALIVPGADTTALTVEDEAVTFIFYNYFLANRRSLCQINESVIVDDGVAKARNFDRRQYHGFFIYLGDRLPGYR